VRGPDLRRRINPLHPRVGRVRIDALFIDAGDHRAQLELDSQLSQVAPSALSKRLGIRRQDRGGGAEQENARLAGVDSTEDAP
jgi:hypothetical protein